MDSSEQDGSSFAKVDVAETENLAEDQGRNWATQSKVWGFFHGCGDSFMVFFSLELELGVYRTIL